MNYKKISQTLLDLGYIDDRRLLCHSNANVAETRNYGVFMKVTSTYQGNLPRFMILSIKDDKLYISFAKAFGGFKAYYVFIELSKIHFINHKIINQLTDQYYLMVDADGGQYPFYINVTKNRKDGKALVDAIIEYHNQLNQGNKE